VPERQIRPCCGIELQVGRNNSDIGLAVVFESPRFGSHRLCVLWQAGIQWNKKVCINANARSWQLGVYQSYRRKGLRLNKHSYLDERLNLLDLTLAKVAFSHDSGTIAVEDFKFGSRWHELEPAGTGNKSQTKGQAGFENVSGRRKR
jgi:hypothetical protein